MRTEFRSPKNGVRHQVTGYLRVSLEEEQTGSKTLETQEARIREFLDKSFGPGHYDVTFFTDNGVSGGYGPEKTGIEKRTRPGLKKAVDLVKSNIYDIWIVYDLSRLVRSLRWLLELREDTILPTKTALVSVCEELDLETDHGLTSAIMTGFSNEMQRSSGIRRTRDAAAMRAEAGYLHGQVGYGWKWQDLGEVEHRQKRRIVVVPEEARWVCHAKDRYLAGWSVGKISAEFRELGVKSPTGLETWHASILGKMLRNPLHAGLVPHRKSGVPKQGEPRHWEQRLYDPEVYEQILEGFKSHKSFPTNTAKSDQYLLNGLVTCARCGRRLYPAQCGRKEPVFSCLTGVGSGDDRCRPIKVKIPLLDEVVIEALERVVQEPAMQELLRQEVQEAVSKQEDELLNQQAQLQEHLAVLKADLTKMTNAFLRGTVDEDLMKTTNADLRSQETEALLKLSGVEAALANRQRRQEQVQQVSQLLDEFPDVWQELITVERREIMRQLVEKLEIEHGESGTVVRLKIQLLPEQVTIIPPQKRERGKKTTTGVARLTPRHLALLHWIEQGRTPQQAAEEMIIPYVTVRALTLQIRRHMGIKDLQEIARLAQGRIQADLPRLPLHAMRGTMAQAQAENPDGIHLSPKLMQVFPLFANGARPTEVATLTGLPRTTVAARYKAILEVLQVKSMYQAAQKAKAQGWL